MPGTVSDRRGTLGTANNTIVGTNTEPASARLERGLSCSSRPGTIGIVGGMGHETTVRLYSMLLRMFQERCSARRNIDYPRICVYGIAEADNVESIGDGNLREDMSTAVDSLTAVGADLIAVPCNTVHNLLGEIRRRTTLPILDMVALTVEELARYAPTSALLLATERTKRNGLYQVPLNRLGITPAVLEPPAQRELDAIILDINAGVPAEMLLGRCTEVIESSTPCDLIILGCTELSSLSPLLLRTRYTVVDSLGALAEGTFRMSSSGVCSQSKPDESGRVQ